MEIKFKVSQDKSSKYIFTTLFEVDEYECGTIVTSNDLLNHLLLFQNNLKEIFNENKWHNILYQADEVKSKLDICLNFSYKQVQKHFLLSLPLTLFIKYSEADLDDIKEHIFLSLYDKWSEFYNEIFIEIQKN